MSKNDKHQMILSDPKTACSGSVNNSLSHYASFPSFPLDILAASLAYLSIRDICRSARTSRRLNLARARALNMVMRLSEGECPVAVARGLATAGMLRGVQVLEFKVFEMMKDDYRNFPQLKSHLQVCHRQSDGSPQLGVFDVIDRLPRVRNRVVTLSNLQSVRCVLSPETPSAWHIGGLCTELLAFPNLTSLHFEFAAGLEASTVTQSILLTLTMLAFTELLTNNIKNLKKLELDAFLNPPYQHVPIFGEALIDYVSANRNLREFRSNIPIDSDSLEAFSVAPSIPLESLSIKLARDCLTSVERVAKFGARLTQLKELTLLVDREDTDLKLRDLFIPGPLSALIPGTVVANTFEAIEVPALTPETKFMFENPFFTQLAGCQPPYANMTKLNLKCMPFNIDVAKRVFQHRWPSLTELDLVTTYDFEFADAEWANYQFAVCNLGDRMPKLQVLDIICPYQFLGNFLRVSDKNGKPLMPDLTDLTFYTCEPEIHPPRPDYLNSVRPDYLSCIQSIRNRINQVKRLTIDVFDTGSVMLEFPGDVANELRELRIQLLSGRHTDQFTPGMHVNCAALIRQIKQTQFPKLSVFEAVFKSERWMPTVVCVVEAIRDNMPVLRRVVVDWKELFVAEGTQRCVLNVEYE
eukprot:809968_1